MRERESESKTNENKEMGGWGGATGTKLFSIPRLIIPLLYLKIDAGMKKGHQSKHQKMCRSNRKSLVVLCCAVLCCTDSVVVTIGRTESDEGIQKNLEA